MYVSPTVCLTLSACLSARLSVRLSVYLCLSNCLYACMSVCLHISLCMPICLPVCTLSVFSPCVYLSIHIYVCLRIWPPAYLYVYLYIHLHSYVFTYIQLITSDTRCNILKKHLQFLYLQASRNISPPTLSTRGRGEFKEFIYSRELLGTRRGTGTRGR